MRNRPLAPTAGHRPPNIQRVRDSPERWCQCRPRAHRRSSVGRLTGRGSRWCGSPRRRRRQSAPGVDSRHWSRCPRCGSSPMLPRDRRAPGFDPPRARGSWRAWDRRMARLQSRASPRYHSAVRSENSRRSEGPAMVGNFSRDPRRRSALAWHDREREA